MADTPTPIGSSTNDPDPCSPCASQPVDCAKDLAQVQAQVCSLASQYAELIRKYGMLQSKLVTQASNSKQFIEELNRLRLIIANLGGDEGCAGMDEVGDDGADGIVVCDSGTSKIIPATPNKQLVSCGGKWKLEPRGLTFHPLSSPAALTVNNGSNSITLPEFPTEACGDIFARFSTYMSTSAGPSGTPGSAAITLGVYQLAQSGIFGSASFCEASAKVTSANVTILVTVSNALTSGQTMKLLGYEY